MSPSAQHIALLTSMGWTHEPRFPGDVCGHLVRGAERIIWEERPELTLDLMASVEAALTEKEKAFYAGELASMLDTHGYRGILTCFATKEQRREAYLRVRGLWV